MSRAGRVMTRGTPGRGGEARALRPALARVLFPLGARARAAEPAPAPRPEPLEEVPLGSGRYELIAPIATGGMAEIFLARRVGLAGTSGPVVVKRLRREVLGNELIERLFVCEGWILSRLRHPNIVGFHDLVQHEGRLHLVIEHLDGVDLARVARALRASGRRMPVGAIVDVGIAVARALAHAHRLEDDEGRLAGLIHRDVSPHNVVVTKYGEIKLVDFGVAKMRAGAAARDTKVGLIKGKVGYMPPEHLRGRPLDGRADLYALGVVLCELVLGRRLFESDSEKGMLRAVLEGQIPAIRAERPECPPELEAVIRCALAREPKHRFETAEAMAAALEDARPACPRGEELSLGELVALARSAPERHAREGGEGPGERASATSDARELGVEDDVDAHVDRDGSTRVETRSSSPPTAASPTPLRPLGSGRPASPVVPARGGSGSEVRPAPDATDATDATGAREPRAAGIGRVVVSGDRLRPLRGRAGRLAPAAPRPAPDRPRPRAVCAVALAPRRPTPIEPLIEPLAPYPLDAFSEEAKTPTPLPVLALRRVAGFVLAFVLGFALAALAGRALQREAREAREAPGVDPTPAKAAPVGAPTHGATLRGAPTR